MMMMRRLTFFFPILALIMLLGSWRSPEEIRQELREISAKAASGDAESQYKMATIYEKGFDTIPRDSVKAMELYRLSAEGGWLPARNYLGFYLVNHGQGAEGLQWLEKAAIAGDAKAQSNLGFLLLEAPDSDIFSTLRDGIVADNAKAAFWLERAAQSGVATASSMLGDLYREGKGVARDSLQAAACYFAAIDAGLADAAYKLESMMREEWKSFPPAEQLDIALYLYTHRAPDLAIPILTQLAGSPKADNEVRGAAYALLGDAYTRAQGVGYSHQLSLKNYYQAAQLGNAPAQFVIAELLEILPDALDDLSADPPTAEQLRQSAARSGITTAEEATQKLLNP